MGKKIVCIFLALGVLVIGGCLLAQALLDHSDASFVPDYPRVELTLESSAQEVFLQTGLSPAAAAVVLAEEGLEGLMAYQDAFFAERTVTCKNIFLSLARQDNLEGSSAPAVAAPEAGDILVSLSSHSVGWRHGHGAILLNDIACLQMTTYASPSRIYATSRLQKLSQYAILRLKDRPEELPGDIFDYCLEKLHYIPYSILSGKTPKEDNLRLMCTSLVWYPYNHFGYDIDADGGWFVSARDILDSPLLEVVQVYGLNPAAFVGRMAQ